MALGLTKSSLSTITIILRYLMLWGAMFIVVPLALARSDTDPTKVTGPNACGECHKEETTVWRGTHHFKTFREMPRNKEASRIAKKMGIKRIKAKSLCLNCHFTTQKIGKKRKKTIAGISCESCHGGGKDWEKLHSEFSGKKKETESKAEAKSRWKKSEKLGMIRPSATYALAKNCYGCHVVPEEKLVNVGGHPAGSEFELVSWSQGEVRHNLWYSKGKSNTKASPGRKRMLYIIGIAVELETALRAVGVATERKSYAVKMARRAAAARKKMAAISRALPNVPELTAMVSISKSAGLKLNNNKALSAAADKIAEQALTVVAKYDGKTFSGIDGLVPASKKYKGKPVK